jgi:hypothetical protein
MSDQRDNAAGKRNGEKAHTAGAFDIRSLIALLVGIYGVVLVIVGIVNHSDSDLTKSDGVNINLWTGIAMVVLAAAMQTWATLRPVIIPADSDTKDDDRPSAH